MPEQNDEPIEIRCNSCGMLMGYRRRQGQFALWCTEECLDTPMAKWQDSQIRDEVVVELSLSGLTVMEITRQLDWPYQYVQQTLNRRGLNEGRQRRQKKAS